MRPDLVVVVSPGFDLGSGVVETDEPVVVQALVAKLAAEALDVAVLDGLPGADEVDLILPRFGGHHPKGVDGVHGGAKEAAGSPQVH